MTSKNATVKGLGEPLRAEWTAERARLLREAVERALAATRRAGKTSKKTAVYEAIRAEYHGRQLPGGRRLRCSRSVFFAFVQKARRGVWDFLTWRHCRQTARLKAFRERMAAQKATHLTILAAAIPVATAEAIRTGEAIAGRRMGRDWQGRRAAILTLVCAEIEARAGAAMSVHRACELAARQYHGADMGGKRLTLSAQTAWRVHGQWLAAGKNPAAFRILWNPCGHFVKLTKAQEDACAAFASECGLTPAAAARELSRRYALPCSLFTMRTRLRGRGLPRWRKRCATPAREIETALNRLAGVFPERPTNGNEPLLTALNAA